MNVVGLRTFLSFEDRMDFENNLSSRGSFVGGILKMAATKNHDLYKEILESHGHVIPSSDKQDAQLFDNLSHTLLQ